ncbi:MAG: 50S ribosomal protein L5 [Chlamydiia bacterium]|nr:50S ribosomal protein L5 [Chlamydiia bacterium]
MSRLMQKYKEEVLPQLKEKHPNQSVMSLPVLRKIVISMGLAQALKDKNALQEHSDELMMLSGQKPVVTKSKKAISNFKLREGQPIGLMVTLRGKRMYDFLDRFCHIVAPRIPDFRGLPKKCDGQGNYVALVTSAQTDEDCIELLTLLGFPFK